MDLFKEIIEACALFGGFIFFVGLVVVLIRVIFGSDEEATGDE